ncbi:MAG: gliding motility-associated C-terminal domain-containing protein [Ferruginibacter sp.]
MRNLLLLLFFAVNLFYSQTTYSQNCIPTNLNGTVVTYPCSATCQNLSFSIPDLRSDESYVVSNVPYMSFPATSGTEVTSTYNDDKYSPLIPLTFPFCFYDSTYNNIIIGSNGIVTFEALCANQDNNYDLDPQIFIPNNTVAAPSGIADRYIPRTAIMAGYMDIDPSITTGTPLRRIEYNVFGSAPCRKFVVSFYNVVFFGGSCSNDKMTSQIVLHEGTGLVEVFITDKPLCTGWNEGNAILGIQDYSRTQGVTAPGKNCTQWSESNTGYRFTPSGTTSRFISCELTTLAGATVATATTSAGSTGMLNANFPNFCPASFGQYLLKTTYEACPTGTIVSIDTININQSPQLSFTAASTNAACGINNGTITVTIPAGSGTPPYSYSLDGGAAQTTNVFTNVSGGTHTVTVTDNNGCTNTISVQVNITASLSGTIASTGTACNGVNNGTITVTATAGSGPYTYVLTPGGTTNTTGVFTGLGSGNYSVTFTDANSCTGTLTTTVNAGSSIGATPVTTATSCSGASDGVITINPTSGTAPYTYSLDGGPAQASNTFTGVAAGSHTVLVRDNNGCTVNVNVTVNTGSGLAGSIFQTPASCPGANDGTVTLNPTTGVAPYTYQLDGGPSQTSNTFTGVTSGLHTVTFTDANGCQGTRSINVGGGTPPNTTATSANTTCAGASDGIIVINPVAGSTYTITPGGSNTTGTFTGLAAGTYTLSITTAGGCTGTITPATVTIAAGAAVTTTATTSAASCPGVSDGSVTVAPVGTGTTTYTLNPGAISNTTGIFNGVAAGTYTVSFVTAAGCTGTISSDPVVTAAAAPTSTATATATSCPTVNDGTVTVASPGAGTTFTLNPGAVSNTTGVFTGLAAGTYTITFVTAAGCNGTVPVSPVVTAGPNRSSSFTKTDPVCANINDGTISITPTAPSAGPYTVTLTGPGGPYTQTGGAPVTFSNLAPGTYNYSFTDAGGCTGTGGPVVLTSNPPIYTPASIVNPSCNGNANGSVTFNPFGGVPSYQYSNNGGAVYQAGNSFTGLAAGTYTFRIKDNAGCIKDTTVTLTQPTVLTAAITGTTPAGCSNNDGTLTGTASGGTTGYTYTITGPTVNTTGAATGIFTALANGAYTITVRDAQGCTATATATVGLTDNMFLELGPDVTICAESSVTFDPQTNAETNVFTWSGLYGTATSTIANPNIKNAVASPLDTATYELHAQWGGCERRDTITVNVLRKPVANAGSDTAICNLTYAILRGSSSNLSGTVNYEWTPSTNVEFPTQAVTRVFPANSDTTYTYTLIVRDEYGCNFAVSDQVDVRVQPPVPAFAGNDTTAVKGVPHQLTATGGSNYLWTPSAPLNNAAIYNPLATLQQDQKFVVRVTDFAGCIGYDTVFVKVYVGPAYYIPNAFTPNGDGLNDVFRPIPVGVARTEYFRIFNRYGETIFETNQWMKGWDGTFKGKKQSIGAYIWVIKGIDREGKAIEMKGTVMLVQ